MRVHANAKSVEPISGSRYMPKWMRRMGNFDQPAAVDAAVTPVAQAMVRAMSAGNSRPLLAAARHLVPHTADILAQHLSAGPPVSATTITPAEARERLAVHA